MLLLSIKLLYFFFNSLDSIVYGILIDFSLLLIDKSLDAVKYGFDFVNVKLKLLAECEFFVFLYK